MGEITVELDPEEVTTLVLRRLKKFAFGRRVVEELHKDGTLDAVKKILDGVLVNQRDYDEQQFINAYDAWTPQSTQPLPPDIVDTLLEDIERAERAYNVVWRLAELMYSQRLVAHISNEAREQLRRVKYG